MSYITPARDNYHFIPLTKTVIVPTSISWTSVQNLWEAPIHVIKILRMNISYLKQDQEKICLLIQMHWSRSKCSVQGRIFCSRSNVLFKVEWKSRSKCQVSLKQWCPAKYWYEWVCSQIVKLENVDSNALLSSLCQYDIMLTVQGHQKVKAIDILKRSSPTIDYSVCWVVTKSIKGLTVMTFINLAWTMKPRI